MFQLFIPFYIGIAMGMTPPAGQQADVPMAGAVAPAETTAEAATETATARAPDPQVPTGQFTTAVEVKPILGMTQASWVAVRDYNGQDLLYFTQLLAWRCGLWEVRYGLNGAPATEVFPLEPCHEGTAQPNALTDVENFLPYITLPPGSVSAVTVELHYDDGTIESASFERPAILMP